MIRTILVCAGLLIGWSFALQSALYAACLYLWIAYFRPESWAWSDIFASLNLSYFAGAFPGDSHGHGRHEDHVRLAQRPAAAVPRPGACCRRRYGVNPTHSMGFWQEFAKMIVVSILLINIIQTSADSALIMIVIALSLGFEATKQGWAQLVLNPGAPNNNTVPFLGDNNLVAVGMAMLIPIIGVLATTVDRVAKARLSIPECRRHVSRHQHLFARRFPVDRRGRRDLALAFAAQVQALAAVVLAAAVILPVLPQPFWDRMSTITASGEERDESQQGRCISGKSRWRWPTIGRFSGVGHSAYARAYNRYDWTGGQYLTNRAVHSAWFGVLAELGYPGMLLFLLIVFGSLRSLPPGTGWRQSAARLEGPLGPYAVAFETSLVAFMVGGSFVSFQYCEMLWHYFALTIVLERVAVREMAAQRALKSDASATPVEPSSSLSPNSPGVKDILCHTYRSSFPRITPSASSSRR